MRVAKLIPALLVACQNKETDSSVVLSNADCEWEDCYGVCMEPYEVTEEFQVSQDEFETYLDSQGLLTERKCEELCLYSMENLEMSVYEFLSCSDMGLDPSNTENHLISCEALLLPYCEGRLHEGAGGLDHNQGRTEKAAWLARTAHCEATSVASFLQLRKQLKLLDAPKEFLDRCTKAALQEVSHARAILRHAEQAGGVVSGLSFGPFVEKSYFSLAIENVVHGLVNEGFAAIMALIQANRCPDKELRKTMSGIAKDELEHVQLAEDLHHWLMSKLNSEEQAHVLEAKKQALLQLKAHWDSRVHTTLDKELGMPQPSDCLSLIDAFLVA